MLDRLQIVKQRFDEISDLIIQDVISDQKRYVQLNQEYKTLKALAEKTRYVMIMANIEEANEIISDNSDADMTEMAKMQLDEAKERLPELEEEIKFMLILKIPKTLRM
jgi:peptide chain release factor 1